MEKIGIERISNGYIVFGLDYKTYYPSLGDARKDFEIEGQNLVKTLEKEERETKNPK